MDPNDPLNPNKATNTICLLGHPEPRSGRGASVRPAIFAQVFSGNAPQFLSLLGYKYNSEFVRKGYWLLYRNTFKIIVSQIYQLEEEGSVQSAQLADPQGSWVVQVSADALNQEQVPRMCEQLDEVKSLFEDYVELVVVDHAFLESKIPYS
ncbi:hypothetical protein IW150_007325 [Coemansia sp. RSA 2607]|nr:hypothetical protein IW150_007325 [Coemansia sp. RSA 2607]